MENQPGKESVSEQIAELTRQLEDLIQKRHERIQLAKKLMSSEDPEKGIFHNKEIFNLKQESLQLEVEAEFCRKKINRLNLGYQV